LNENDDETTRTLDFVRLGLTLAERLDLSEIDVVDSLDGDLELTSRKSDGSSWSSNVEKPNGEDLIPRESRLD